MAIPTNGVQQHAFLIFQSGFEKSSIDGEKRNSRMCARMELKRFSQRNDEKISNMSRPSVSNPHECVHVVHPHPPKSRKWLKSAAGRRSSSETRLSRTNNLEPHTEGGGDERKRATGVLNPQKKNKNKFLTHRNNWSKLFLECIALKFPGFNICSCFSTSKEEKKNSKYSILIIRRSDRKLGHGGFSQVNRNSINFTWIAKIFLFQNFAMKNITVGEKRTLNSSSATFVKKKKKKYLNAIGPRWRRTWDDPSVGIVTKEKKNIKSSTSPPLGDAIRWDASSEAIFFLLQKSRKIRRKIFLFPR